MLLVIGTDYTCCCKSNYHMITTTTVSYHKEHHHISSSEQIFYTVSSVRNKYCNSSFQSEQMRWWKLYLITSVPEIEALWSWASTKLCFCQFSEHRSPFFLPTNLHKKEILQERYLLIQILSEWVIVFNANSAIFQLYHGKNRLIFIEMTIRSALF